jgi:type VI secretion system protein ImpK
MNSDEDAFGSNGRTIIRPNPSRPKTPNPAGPAPGGARAVPPDATVVDPGIAQQPLSGRQSGTVIYQGAPFTDHTPAADNSFHKSGAEAVQTMPQDAVLKTLDGVGYSAANPIMTAAAPLLVLLGQLRLMGRDTDAASLATLVANAISKFEREITEAGVPEEDARIAKFALCETADDIIQHLPGFDRDRWTEHSMLSRFFGVRVFGAGFFNALNKLLADPETHYDLLEFMHACLSLGFEGQYRGIAREDRNLERVRQDVYDTLRYSRARATDDISLRWRGLAEAMSNTPARAPFWSIAAGVLVLLAGSYVVLRVLITNDGEAVSERLLALYPAAPITIERGSFVPLVEDVRSISQLDRIRDALVQELAAGGVTVEANGDFIVVQINSLLLFESGKADAKAEFEPIARAIANALDPEPGPIKIVGHTDNLKPGRSSVFKSNHDLSVARAKAVHNLVAPKLSDPSRTTVEGKGEDEPIADNATPEGRAKNRRVDVMVLREETL